MREWQSQSHVRWYCRYHVVWVPKYRKPGDLRRDVTWDWEHRSGAVSAAGRGVGRRARAVGSRACVVGHPAEVQRGEHGGVSERAVGDPHPSGVSGAATQLHGLPLLGARVLRQHGRFGRRGHPRLHPEAGSRGKETREAGTRLIEGPFEGPSSYRPLRGRWLIPTERIQRPVTAGAVLTSLGVAFLVHDLRA